MWFIYLPAQKAPPRVLASEQTIGEKKRYYNQTQ